MIEYILIPKYFNCHNIYSKNLNEFFSNVTDKDYIDDNKIDLEYLRKFYKNDKYKTLKIIKELKMRGFKFKEERTSSFLSTMTIPQEYNKFLYTDINNQKYKEINRYIFDFLDYSLIKDDRFFNGVPLIGFKNYNKNIKEVLIEKEFLRYGYKIVSLKEYLNLINVKNYNFSEIDLENNDKDMLLKDKNSNLDIEKNKLLNKVYQESKIEDIFRGISGFKHQLKILRKENINNLIDYDSKILDNEKFDTIVDNYKKNLQKEIDCIFNSKFELSENFYELINNKSIYEVYLFLNKLDNNFIIEDLNLLVKFKSMKILDIYNKNYVYYNNNYRINLYKLNKKINNTFDLNILFKNFLLSNNIDARTLLICQERYINKKTLDETGQKFDITRERVRQITNKIEKQFLSNAFQKDLKKILKFLFNKDIINCSNIEKMIENDYMFFLELFKLKKSKFIRCYELTNRLYLLNENDYFDWKFFDKKISNIINELDVIGDYNRIIYSLRILESELGQITDDIIENIFDLYNIRKVNNKYVILKDIKANNDKIDIYMKFICKGSLDLSSSKDINKLNSDFLIYFGEKTDRELRSWEGIFRRADEIILINPRTYIHINNLKIDRYEIDWIKKKIDKYLNEIDFIYADTLYLDIKNEYSNILIKSKHELYSLIKYFYIDDFNFATGNSLKFSKKHTLEKTNTEILYDICNDYKEPITYKEIIARTEWNRHRIEMAISNSDNIIKFGTDKCVIPDNLFIGNEKELFKNKIKLLFEDKFTSSSIILDHLIFSEDLSSFISRNNLTDTIALTNLIKYINKDIKGHTVVLYTKDSPVKSIDDLIRFKFKNGFNRKDIIALLEKYKFARGSLDLINGILEKFIENKEYLPLNREEYIKYEDFHVKDEFIEKVIKYSDNIYKKNSYIIPNKMINGIKKEIGNTEYGLNQYIITNILRENGYKKIYRYNEDYRYEIIVLVKNNSIYDSINYLVYDLLNSDYRGEWHRVPIYDYLSEKGFCNIENDKSKKFLNEDITLDLIEVDLAGRVKLKEVKN